MRGVAVRVVRAGRRVAPDLHGRGRRILQNVRVPRRLRHRLAAGLVAAGLALQLAACASAPGAPFPATGPGSEPTGRAAAKVVHRADRTYQGARVLEDRSAGTLTIVPPRSNGSLVVFLHGWGQTRWALLERRSEAGVAHALTAAGFTVVGADARLKAWGDPASVADYRRVIAATMRQHRLHDVFLMGESMGGLATMQLARQLPAVRAVVAWYPVCDLRTMRQSRFQATITDAWAGRSRAAVSPVAVSDKPMLIWASPQDTVVRADRNAAVCAAEARAAGAQVTYFRTTGEHGDPSNFAPESVVDFFLQHRLPVV